MSLFRSVVFQCYSLSLHFALHIVKERHEYLDMYQMIHEIRVKISPTYWVVDMAILKTSYVYMSSYVSVYGRLCYLI